MVSGVMVFSVIGVRWPTRDRDHALPDSLRVVAWVGDEEIPVTDLAGALISDLGPSDNDHLPLDSEARTMAERVHGDLRDRYYQRELMIQVSRPGLTTEHWTHDVGSLYTPDRLVDEQTLVWERKNVALAKPKSKSTMTLPEYTAERCRSVRPPSVHVR